MKILHINSYYVKDFFYTNLYEYQKQHNDIEVIVHKSKNTFNDFNKENCTVISASNKLDKFLFFTKHQKIYNEIKKFNIDYDIVHAHTLFSNGIHAYYLKKDFNINYIVAVRSTDINVFFKYFVHTRNIGKNILLNASKIIFISDSYKYSTLKYINKKYHQEILNKSIVVPNGVNSFWIENQMILPKKIEGKIKILHVARINKNKNAILIVKAIEILLKKGYDIELDIIGKVEDEKLLITLLEYNFVNHYIFMSKEKLINYYKEASIFILASHNETFGISYLEAISQAIPVIYTKNEGFDKLFSEGFVGYSVDSNNYNELANKIEEVMRNYEELSSNCINVVNEFNWDIIGKKYDEIYKEVINDE